MSGSGPVRTGVSFLVGLLSLVVLGVVWGTVVLHLPKQEQPAPSTAPPLSVPPVAAVPLPQMNPAPPPPGPPTMTVPSPPPAGEPAVSFHEAPVAEVLKVEAPPISASVELKCQAEVEQLCPDGGPGGDRRRCLQHTGHNLSPVCRQVVQERTVRMKEGLQRIKAACEADVRQFCRNVPPGPGRMMHCLEEHSQDVSEPCYRSLPRRGVLN